MNINFAQLEIAGESNIGPVRHHNEDSFLICSPPGGAAVLAVIADGIGGHSRGEVASNICCREMAAAARRIPSDRWDAEFLKNTLLHANTLIFDFNYRNRRLKPMGCTVAAAVFFKDKVICASAGDSRIYEFSRSPGKNPLRQLTTDHRPEGYDELLRSENFQHVSLVSKSLGTAKYLELDIQEFSRPENARYLLCSDGLYNRQPNQVFSGVLGSGVSARAAAGQLLRGALLSGERDNITVICAVPVSNNESGK